jgi:ribonuclease D
LHDKLNERLQRLGRGSWVDEACAAMVSNADDVPPPHELWRKVGGRSSLDRKQLAVLRELCIWRDEEAQRRNKPRRSVLKDDVLVEIARRKPATARAVMELRNAPPNLGERTAAELVSRVRAGLDVPPERHPETEDSVSLDDQGGALYELLSAVVKVRAIDVEIAPTLLAPGEPLKQVAATRRADPDNMLFRTWRDELIGRHLRAALAGELSVAWDAAAGRLVLR